MPTAGKVIIESKLILGSVGKMRIALSMFLIEVAHRISPFDAHIS